MKQNIHEIIFSILKCYKNQYLSKEFIYQECIRKIKKTDDIQVYDEDFQKYFLIHIMTIQSKYENIEIEDDIDENIESLMLIDDDVSFINSEISNYSEDYSEDYDEDYDEDEFDEDELDEDELDEDEIENDEDEFDDDEDDEDEEDEIENDEDEFDDDEDKIEDSNNENMSEDSTNYELNYYSKNDLIEYIIENKEINEIQDLLEYKDQYNNNFIHLIFQLNNKESLKLFLNENNQHLLIEKNDHNKTPIDMMSNKMLKEILTCMIEKNNKLENKIEKIEKNQNQLCQINFMNYLSIHSKMNILGVSFLLYMLKDLFVMYSRV